MCSGTEATAGSGWNGVPIRSGVTTPEAGSTSAIWPGSDGPAARTIAVGPPVAAATAADRQDRSVRQEVKGVVAELPFRLGELDLHRGEGFGRPIRSQP